MPQSNQTEQATPRRRQKAREKGQVARSRDLIGAASGMAAIFVLFSLMSSFPLAWRGFLNDCLEGAISGNLRMDALSPFLTHTGLFVATGAALALGWIAALSSALAQGGLVFAPSSLMPTGSRMSPAAKLGQLFSITALARTYQVSASRHRRHLHRHRLSAPRLAFAHGALRPFLPRHARLCHWTAFSKWPGNPRSFFLSGPFSTTCSNASTFRAN